MEQDWHAKIRQTALEALSEAPRRSKILQKGLTVSKKDDREVSFWQYLIPWILLFLNKQILTRSLANQLLSSVVFLWWFPILSIPCVTFVPA